MEHEQGNKPTRSAGDELDASEAKPSTETGAPQYGDAEHEGIDGVAKYAQMIVDTVRDALLVLTSDLEVKSANESFYEMFDTSPEETEGRLVYELSDGQWDIDELRRLLEEILPEEKALDDYVVEHEFQDLGHRTMLLNARQIDEHQLLLLTIDDVTERQATAGRLRKTQERLRLLVENAEEYAIFTMDEERHIDMWSRGAERIFGWSEEETIGEPADIIFAEEDRRKGIPDREMARARDSGSSLDERWHLRKDGSLFWASGFLVALRDDSELHGYAKIVRNNTERKQAEEERKALLEALEYERDQLRTLNDTLEEHVDERTRQVRELASTLTRAEQEERRRISQILHDDLQQQLYGLQMKMRLMRQHAEAGRVGEMLADVEEAEKWLQRGVEVTRNLTVDLSPPVLQGEGLRDALAWLQTQMRELHGLHVQVKADKAFHMPDEDMQVLLFQIIRELLFNVVKHADTDEATVELTDVDHHLMAVVVDAGRGFDMDEVTARAAHEAGFGLFSIRERIGLFGGSVEIESAPGEGTRVSVEVPVQLD